MHRLYLVKGPRATTAIEGNTLSEEQIRAQLDSMRAFRPLRSLWTGERVFD